MILHSLPACCCDFIICLKKKGATYCLKWAFHFIVLPFLLLSLSFAHSMQSSCTTGLWFCLQNAKGETHCVLLLYFTVCSGSGCYPYFYGLIYFVPDLSRILSLLFRWPCAHSLAVVTFYDVLVAKQPFAVRGSRLLSIMDVYSSSMKAEWLF